MIASLKAGSRYTLFSRNSVDMGSSQFQQVMDNRPTEAPL